MGRSAVYEPAAVPVSPRNGATPPQANRAPVPLPSVDALLPLVYSIARTMSYALPAVVELDDLVHDGVVGLLECARRFDPSRGVDFRTYASHRIRGAILDGLRARDPLPRSLRRAAKAAGRAAGEGRDGTRPGPLRVATQFLSLDDVGPVSEEAPEPEAELLAKELRTALVQAMAALPPRDREILRLRFGRGMRLRQVAAHCRISVSRVAELQERAVRRLRAVLEVPRAAELSPNGRRRRGP
ncbi:MAG: sigma-70 family RNA polymerase sigma factor [Armatimonadota bacterium]|nr:sigma-70 family RNA polymerase sigma factor [Armatimonadota bacterium]MDR7463781.1 sigma-70 family RNA polymerase sigma factor [Armatimonadota bacterium]MDR7469473.1 sigma-70 family RNA polymerase sigma factor [Armatimonadota bacterium]MDR7539120.1 sigma-70 family RNA polymerase sigma factor [Armatimonadota bacterium]